MNTTLIIILFIAATLIFLVWRAKTSLKNIPAVADHEKIVKLTDKNFSALTKNKLIIVDFWASWCAPCKLMAPVLNEVASELSVGSYVGKVNVEEQQALAQRFKIRSIPTLILFKNGAEVDRFVGIKSKDFIIKKMKISL